MLAIINRILITLISLGGEISSESKAWVRSQAEQKQVNFRKLIARLYARVNGKYAREWLSELLAVPSEVWKEILDRGLPDGNWALMERAAEFGSNYAHTKIRWDDLYIILKEQNPGKTWAEYALKYPGLRNLGKVFRSWDGCAGFEIFWFYPDGSVLRHRNWSGQPEFLTAEKGLFGKWPIACFKQ